TVGTLRTDRSRRLGRLLHPARFDRRPAGPALEASDLIAQRGIRSLQLRHLLKQFDHQALQLGMGQAIKIDRRRHAQNESDSRRRGNLIIIPPWVLPLLRLLVTNPSRLLRCALKIPAFAWSPKSNRSESNQIDRLGAMTISIHFSSLFLRLPI